MEYDLNDLSERHLYLQVTFKRLLGERALNVEALLAIMDHNDTFVSLLLKKFSELCPQKWVEITDYNENHLNGIFSAIGVQTYTHEARDFMLAMLREHGVLDVKRPPLGGNLFIRMSPGIMPYLTRRVLSLAKEKQSCGA